jgi:PAS domain-containing protein
VITYVNDYFARIAGYTPEELVGQNHNIVRHPDMPAAAFGDLWANGVNVCWSILFYPRHLSYIIIADDIGGHL